VCAAEASGDALGAALARALLAREVAVSGVAGPQMRAAGVEVVARAEDASALGLVEVVGALPRIARVLRAVERALDPRPTCVVGIDAPGLMSRIGARCRRRSVRYLQWVAPQVWAWNPGRAAGIARWADEVLCLFPFEPLWLRPHGVDARFVGHPWAASHPRSMPPGPPIVALLPGSRPAEIARHWPVLRDTAARLRERWPGCRFRVGRAPTAPADALANLDARLVDGVAAALEGAHVAITCSGTASLEVAAAGVPQVVIYQVHPVTWHIGRRLSRVPFLALPNLLAGGAVVPEHLQRLDPAAIAGDVARLLGPAGAAQVAALRPALGGLAPDAAIERVLERVLYSGSMVSTVSNPSSVAFTTHTSTGVAVSSVSGS
jgi:lipid-A-disaccharide synthase